MLNGTKRNVKHKKTFSETSQRKKILIVDNASFMLRQNMIFTLTHQKKFMGGRTYSELEDKITNIRKHCKI